MDSPKNRDVESRFTKIDDLYGDSANYDVETEAILVIYSGGLHPSKVTQLLGVDPTDTVAIGEPIIRTTGIGSIGRVNGWFLDSRKHVKSKDLRRHLDWLVDQLKGSVNEIRLLQQMEGVQMYVKCLWRTKSETGGPALWPEQMAGLAAMNLECYIHFMCYPEPEQPEVEPPADDPEYPVQ